MPGTLVLASLLLSSDLQAQTTGVVVDRRSQSAYVVDLDAGAIEARIPLPDDGGNQVSSIYTSCYGDVVLTPDGNEAWIATARDRVWVVDMTLDPPALAGGVNPVPLSMEADQLELTADGRFLLVANRWATGPGTTALVVVDTLTRSEHASLAAASPWPGNIAGLDIDPGGNVLACWWGVSNPLESEMRRFHIDAMGQLSENEMLHLDGSFGFEVELRDDASVGWVSFDGDIVTFGLPLDGVDDQLEIPDSGFPIDLLADSSNQRLYVRGRTGVYALDTDPVSGVPAATPRWSRATDFTYLCATAMDRMALSPDGTRLFVTIPVPRKIALGQIGGPPPRRVFPHGAVLVLDAETGATLDRVFLPGASYPGGIAVW